MYTHRLSQNPKIMEDPRSETGRNCNGLLHDIYRSHPKDAEDTVFTGVCLSTGRGGGTPVPGSFPGSLVPGLFLGATLVLGFFPGLLSQIFSEGGTPVPARGGTPERGTLTAGTGVLPPFTPRRQNSRASTCYAAGGMSLAVTQEDFLMYEIIITGVKIISYCFHCLRGRVGAFTMTCT